MVGNIAMNRCKAAISKARFRLVERPPHGPDLAPSDHQLFPKLRKKIFSPNNDVNCTMYQKFAEVEQSLSFKSF